MSDISRVTRTHAQARASYDRLSRWYDFIEGGWETPPRRLGIELLQLKTSDQLLEIGSGTGSTLMEISDQVHAVGLDLSVKMLVQTRARLGAAGRPTRLVQGDALRLPFPTGCFSAVFMAFTLELMDTPEISQVLDEIRRILLPAGRLGVVSLSKLGGVGFMTRLYEWSHARFPAAVDCRPIYARNALEAAGFVVMEHRLLSLTGLGVEIVMGHPGT